VTDRAAYEQIADRLEAGLHALGWWGSPAPADPPTTAFGVGDRTFAQWLEHTLVPRLRETANGSAEPPSSSMVATQAIREFDGLPDTDPLIAVLSDLDRLVAG
jgi:uncharacterized protein YqcC (DUF446 family)